MHPPSAPSGPQRPAGQAMPGDPQVDVTGDAPAPDPHRLADSPPSAQSATEPPLPPLPPHLPWRDGLRHPEFGRGIREMAGVAVGIGAWGLVTGVTMVKVGLSPWIAVLMSVTVFAGSAQLATAPLIASGAPLWVIWATAACLNLRFVIFSAQLRPYFAHKPAGWRTLYSYFCADLNYVLFTRRFPDPRPSPEQPPYFWGGVLANAGAWHVMSLTGIALGHRVPEAWGLGFTGSVALLALTYSLLGDRRTWIPTVLAAGAAIVAVGLPLKLNMLVAIATAIVIGTVIDHAPGSGRRRA